MRPRTWIPMVCIAVLSAILLSLTAAPSVRGAETVIDEDSFTFSPAEPTTDDTINITVDIVFVDSEPVEDGVRLKWGLCTDMKCEDYQTLVMDEIAVDGVTRTFTTMIGGFPAEDDAGDQYVDLRYYIVVESTATDGSDDPGPAESKVKEIFFASGSADDDDSGTNGDDSEDSSLSLVIIIAAAVATTGAAAFRRKRL